jgi:hypothetical protein
MRYTKQEITDARALAESWVKPGDTVHTIVRHVSRSGMSRNIDAVKLTDGDYLYLSRIAAVLLGYPQARDGSVKIGGCGMDMGFALVYELSHALFSGGFECIGEGCPSNDHSNGDRDYSPHQHNSGGYALKQRWL